MYFILTWSYTDVVRKSLHVM